ncbi:MAG: DNA-directed RNA polymerase subunit N [Candidatus Bathyarchaeia archaeon]
MIPVRCFSCGALVGHKWEEFERRIKDGEDAGKVLDDLGVRRYCCRSTLLSHVEVIDDVLKYFTKSMVDKREKEGEKEGESLG